MGTIVVGVDGSPGSLAALAWAVHEAPARHATVRAVTAWEFPPESSFGAMTTAGDFHPVAAAEEVLLKALADVGVSDQDGSVTTAPVEGQPAEVLIAEAQDAELLVVGSRGHGTLVGMLLGSVSQYVAAHSPCPVVVIKPGAPDGQ